MFRSWIMVCLSFFLLIITSTEAQTCRQGADFSVSVPHVGWSNSGAVGVITVSPERKVENLYLYARRSQATVGLETNLPAIILFYIFITLVFRKRIVIPLIALSVGLAHASVISIRLPSGTRTFTDQNANIFERHEYLIQADGVCSEWFVLEPVQPDLKITGVMFMQGASFMAGEDGIRVEGKRLLVRALVSNNSNIFLRNSTTSLTMNGQEIGKHSFAMTPSVSSPGNLQTTANFIIESSALKSGITEFCLSLDVESVISEINETNNINCTTVAVKKSFSLNIVVVPVRIKYDNVDVSPTQEEMMRAFDMTRKIFPTEDITISFRGEGITVDYPILNGIDGYTLLRELEEIKILDGIGPERIYYGMWGYQPGLLLGAANMLYGDIAVGTAVEPNAGWVTAHELSHLHGRKHSLCQIRFNADEEFPYLDGSIGKYGWDPVLNKIIFANTKDFMGYCTPNWISDYHYRGIYESGVNRFQQQKTNPEPSVCIMEEF